ncbi:hypothetical protein [Agrobacterium cavarae]|uniref:hypothetical protein n=1 Tax=Agrobacterium cavarae TaxID=2528239 RepID=UPI000DDD1A12|nr:hypothetical protein [Agrobacterium cavarae]
MKYEMYRFINQLFIRYSGGPEVLDQAILSHQKLKSIVQSLFMGQRASGLPDDLVAAIDRVIDRLKFRHPIGEKYSVDALSSEVLSGFEGKDDRTFFPYIAPLLAGYRHFAADAVGGNQPRVQEELMSLISWETILSAPEGLQSIIAPKLQTLEQEADRKAQMISEAMSEHQKIRDSQQLYQAQAAEAIAKAEMQLTAAGHAFEQKAIEFEDRNQEIDADIRQLRADLDAQVAKFGTEAARKLWGEREKQSRFALVASSVAIFLLIAAPILGAICFTTEVLHYLAQIVAASSLPITDATGQVLPAPNDTQITIAAIGRLVIITVPVFLYIWAIRLVVRFNSRSLMLLDDARLRLTMLDTFFHLIEKEGAVKEDRALVLNALFRPGPGHGDNVDPPNFTELVTKAMGSTPGK